MALSHSQLKSERAWRAATGMNEAGFLRIVPLFQKAYESKTGISMSTAQTNLNYNFLFDTYEKLLFFVLFTLKNPTTFDVNGLIFGISQSASESNFKKGLLILKEAFEDSNHLPKRAFKNEEALIAFVNQHKVLKIDCTEINIQRPTESQKQKDAYSGKKKTYP